MSIKIPGYVLSKYLSNMIFIMVANCKPKSSRLLIFTLILPSLQKFMEFSVFCDFSGEAPDIRF